MVVNRDQIWSQFWDLCSGSVASSRSTIGGTVQLHGVTWGYMGSNEKRSSSSEVIVCIAYGHPTDDSVSLVRVAVPVFFPVELLTMNVDAPMITWRLQLSGQIFPLCRMSI